MLLSVRYVGEPDAAMSCPSGSEGAGRKRTSERMQRAALPPYATLMLQQGIHPKVVQERLGHADISLTLRTYSHVLPDIQEEAAEKFDLLLISPEAKMNSERLFISQADSPKIEI